MSITKYTIDESAARVAKEINSFGEYKEGGATNTYYDLVNQFEREVNELIERNKALPYPATDEQLELIEYYTDKYSKKLAQAINRENAIDSMCPSVLVCGAGNFPTRKKEKQNAARDKFYKECGDLFEPTGNYYFKKIKTILTNSTIYSNDALAVEKLKNKLNDLEEQHAEMKARNVYYRKNGTMVGYEGMSDKQAIAINEAVANGYAWEKQPYQAWRLTNSNAEIRRLKKRIEELEKYKEQSEVPNEDKYPNVEGVKVVENGEAMRIQLIFDGKPDDETRTLLKSYGFRWSPKFGAWQRQLNNNGIYATQTVLGKLK